VKYSTIQVTPRMRRRLARYKLPGMSYEAVIESLTDAISAEEFRARRGRALASARTDLRAALGQGYAAGAEAGRRMEAERIARMTPGERMEEAYRLFELLRGRA
jgi:hypothetical protein